MDEIATKKPRKTKRSDLPAFTHLEALHGNLLRKFTSKSLKRDERPCDSSGPGREEIQQQSECSRWILDWE